MDGTTNKPVMVDEPIMVPATVPDPEDADKVL